MRSRRGVTLVEITVASFLLTLLLTVAVKVFIPAMKSWADGQKRSEASQSALVTANWIGDDMLRSSPGSVQLTPEKILVMKCAPSQTKDHTNTFSQAVAFWLDGSTLYRGSQDLTSLPDDDPGAPPAVGVADLLKLDAKRKLSENVGAFDAEVVQPWRIVLRMKIDRGGRTVALETSYSSIYAPFDPNIAEAQNDLDNPAP